MPELPDIEVYLEALRERLLGERLQAVRLASPFLLRSVEPTIESCHGRELRAVTRIGKRIVFELCEARYLVIHLMIAGRFQWRAPEAKLPARLGLAAFDFESGSLLLTEASKQKRASLHVVDGAEALGSFSRGGIEPLESTLGQFREALQRETHTLKRTLTDPRLISGVGNAYSDEILHAARLSPFKRTDHLSEEEIRRLRTATRQTLRDWLQRLRKQRGDRFPSKVTAFHEAMAVHGRYGMPCPTCGDPVQRIVYAANECNYCARCQTAGKLLADRGLSRLLKKDWPKTLEELERRMGRG